MYRKDFIHFNPFRGNASGIRGKTAIVWRMIPICMQVLVMGKTKQL